MIEDPTPGTPQEAAEGFRQAMIAREWERAMSYLTRDMQKGMVGGLCMGAAYAVQGDLGKGESFADVLNRHGMLGQSEVPDSMDLGLVFRDIMQWVDANLANDEHMDLAGAIAASTYSDFRIDGDLAYARQSGPKGDTTVRLRKIDGFWYVGDQAQR